jgi:hypothetical protein
VLYPGEAVSGNLPLNFYNPLSVAIDVTSLTVKFTNAFPTNCASSAFQVNGTALAGSPPQATLTFTSGHYIHVAGNSATSPGATYDATLALANSGNQTTCENLALTMAYTATAQYSDNTTTVLASSPSPSYPGNPVTLTATVTPANPSGDSTAPNTQTLASESSPNNQVKFYSCTSTATSSCSATAFATGTITYNSLTGYTATTSVSPSTPGSYYYEAIYPGSGANGDFSASPASNVVTQVVQYSSACVSPPTSSANVTLTGTTSGNYTVASGKSVWLDGGTITGSLTVPSTSQFAATGGAINGNISSAGPLSLQGTKVGGNITSTGGGVAIGPGSVISGNLTDSGAGAVCAVGTSPSPVKISGNISVENLPTSSVPNTFCALTLGGGLTYEKNGAPVVIGGSSACPGDTISGNLIVESNTASVTVGGSGYGNTVGGLTVESNAGVVTVYGNTVSGNIAVESNTVGGGTLTSNSAGGTCTLSGNNPKITVPSATSNTAKGTNNCKANG